MNYEFCFTVTFADLIPILDWIYNRNIQIKLGVGGKEHTNAELLMNTQIR